MKREARLLLQKASDSLLVAVEHFNRPQETGRTTTVLILLDHAFEMLLKAAILHRGGSLRDSEDEHTIGFAKCVRKGVSEGDLKFLSEEQAITLQVTNGFRDAAQHHLLDLCEEQLYTQAQASVTLFGDLLVSVFGVHLHDRLPKRVLPISTVAPKDIDVFFDRQVNEILGLLAPNRRRTVEADAMLRPLAIMDNAIHGDTSSPTPNAITAIRTSLRRGVKWQDLLPGVASMRYSTNGEGPSLALRLTKKEGVAIHIVPEDNNSGAVAVKRVNELDYYCFGHTQLAEKTAIGRNIVTALIWYTQMKGNPDYHKQIHMGKSHFDRYSPKAVDRLREVAANEDADAIWQAYKKRNRIP